jgi:hypothetical protein
MVVTAVVFALVVLAMVLAEVDFALAVLEAVVLV